MIRLFIAMNGSHCEMTGIPTIIPIMTGHSPRTTPARVIAVLVGLLLLVTTFALLHWHKDWTDRGCQLCHVRNLPSLHSATGVVYGAPVIFQEDWNCEHSSEELETCI